MKKTVWLGVLVSLAIIVATAFLVFHRRVMPLTTRQTAARATQSATDDGITDAESRDEELWKKTPESTTVREKLFEISAASKLRGGPTADEAEVLVKYMHSPHYSARHMALIAAARARFDPARSVLLPHVLRLLSDPIPDVRFLAAYTLGEMGDKSVIPNLEPLLNDDYQKVRDTARTTISKLQSQKEAVPGK